MFSSREMDFLMKAKNRFPNENIFWSIRLRWIPCFISHVKNSFLNTDRVCSNLNNGKVMKAEIKQSPVGCLENFQKTFNCCFIQYLRFSRCVAMLLPRLLFYKTCCIVVLTTSAYCFAVGGGWAGTLISVYVNQSVRFHDESVCSRGF